MKHKFEFSASLMILISVFFSSCKKEDRPGVSHVLFANAGRHLIMVPVNDTVILDGTHSRALNGTINTYVWRKIDGPKGDSLFDIATGITLVKGMVGGIYHFELEIVNNFGLSAKDTVSVIAYHNFKGRVAEFKTGTPIPDSRIKMSAFQADANGAVIWHELNLSPDSKGEFSFQGLRFRDVKIDKDGYWPWFSSNSSEWIQWGLSWVFPSETSLFVNTTSLYVNTLRDDGLDYYTCDSFELRMMAKDYITVHIKDSLGISPSNLTLGCYGSPEPEPNIVEGYFVIHGQNIAIRPHIDSTFQFPIFGNAGNDIIVFNSLGNINDFIFKDTRHIDKGSHITLNITY